MKHKGRLIRWNKDRGFGFIQCSKIHGDVFIHISQLEKMSRPPKVGDIIYFDPVANKKSKAKAINAKIEGVSEIVGSRPKRKQKREHTTVTLLKNVIVLGVIAIVGYMSFPAWSKFFVNSRPVGITNKDFTGYRCEGKHYCSEMTSCQEARFYLKNCPNVKIDGDHDGVPCESQWCN